MSKKKKGKKETETPNLEAALQGETPEAPEKGKGKSKKGEIPQTVATGKNVVKAIYGVFALLTIFYLYNAYSSFHEGQMSIPLMMGLALGGFLVAFLSRQLERSAYFQLYRVFSVLLFLAVGVSTFFRLDMDGFLTGIVGVFSASVMLGVIMPFIFEGIEVEKVVLYTLCLFFALGIGYLAYTSGNVTIREKAVTFEGIYPAAVSLAENGKLAWIYGDNRLLREGGKGPVVFKILTNQHPEVAIALARKKALEEQKERIQQDKKKKKDKASPTPSPSVAATAAEGVPGAGMTNLAFSGEFFTTSLSKDGLKLAVTGWSATPEDQNNDKEKAEPAKENLTAVIDLETQKKTIIFTDKGSKPFFPAKSFNYPDYSTWNETGDRFFFFTVPAEGEGGMKLYVVEPSQEKVTPVELEGVLSACWAGPEELRIITGEKEDVSLQVGELPGANMNLLKQEVNMGIFSQGIKNGVVHTWKPGMEKPEKTVDMDSGTKVYSVHPRTGKILTFNGSTAGILAPGSTSFESKTLAAIPGPYSNTISTDGKMLAFARDGNVYIYNLETGENKTAAATRDIVMGFTFSPDGKYLLYSSVSRSQFLYFHCNIIIYNIADGNITQIHPNLLTGYYRSGRLNAAVYPPLTYLGFYCDPYRPGIYFEQLTRKNPLGNTTYQVSFWKLLGLYPENKPAIEEETETKTEEVKPEDNEEKKLMESSPAEQVESTPAESETPDDTSTLSPAPSPEETTATSPSKQPHVEQSPAEAENKSEPASK